MKRIWFTQQKPYDWMPLRAGLGLVSERDLYNYQEREYLTRQDGVPQLCKKIYTTRTHRLSGEYYVVKGSRFKAKAVEPRIEFQVRKSWKLDLLGLNLTESFPELDLGIKGATFNDLKNELLKLNKTATIDTPFYISKLEPLEV